MKRLAILGHFLTYPIRLKRVKILLVAETAIATRTSSTSRMAAPSVDLRRAVLPRVGSKDKNARTASRSRKNGKRRPSTSSKERNLSWSTELKKPKKQQPPKF